MVASGTHKHTACVTFGSVTTIDHWLPLLRTPGGAQTLHWDNRDLADEAGGRYPVVDGIPRMLPDGALGADDARYQRLYDRLAPLYVANERIGARLLFSMDLRAEQQRMVAGLPIEAGSRVLEVSPGPGVFQPWLAQAVGAGGELAAVDLSWGMVRRCAARTARQVPVPLICQGNGAALPFADGAFDALFHFGGIKLFSEPGQAFAEFARVVRPGGMVFVGDEGVAPDLPDGWRLRFLRRTNPGFDRPPPVPPSQLVVTAQSWVYGGYAFLWTLTRAGVAA